MRIIYHNIIKKALSFALVLAGGMGLTSCSDFLEVEPQNIITIDQFWNEEADVNGVVAGCYSALATDDVIARMMVWGEFRSENIYLYGTSIERDVNLERILKENIVANNSYTAWNAFYNIINRCNVILQYAPQVAENDPSYTASELDAHKAEATAIRSLCYFYLIRAFRNVPYTEEAYLDDAQEMNLPQEKFEVILPKLISSLEAVKDKAINRYPSTTSDSKLYNTARITRSAIYAMLADMYLWNGNYDKCIECADWVIDYKKKIAEEKETDEDYSLTNGFPLIPCKITGSTSLFGRAFNEIFVKGNSSESIFEISFTKGSGRNGASNGPVSNFYGNVDRKGCVKASNYVGKDITNSTPSVFNNKYDGRAYENIVYSADKSPTDINKYVVTNSSSVLFSDPSASDFFSAGSFWGSHYDTYDEGSTKYISLNKSNFIIYRLTDVMLLKAEALVLKMSGENPLTEADEQLRQQAFTLVNAVNKRSLYQTEPKDTLEYFKFKTPTALINLVYDERNRELMFEGKRYFDLVRRALRENDTYYLREKVKQRSTDVTTLVEAQMQKMDAIFWPVNLDEMKVNDQLTQNPAFGSGENASYQNSAK